MSAQVERVPDEISKRAPSLQLHDSSEASAIPTGVLTEIWSSKEELQRLSFWGSAAAALQRGLRVLVALPWNNAVALLSIAIALWLFLTLLLVTRNAQQFLSFASQGSSETMVAFLRKGSSASEIEGVRSALAALPGSREIRVVTEAEALASFRKEIGARSDLLTALGGDNPLPASVEVQIANPESVAAFADLLRAEPLVEEVVSSGEWTKRLRGMISFSEILTWVFGSAVFIAAIFLVSNTMRLLIYARRDEISIMKLVGASDSFIRIPFLVAGGLQGFAGAAVALFFGFVAFSSLGKELADLDFFGLMLPPVVFLDVKEMAVFLLFGLAIGAIASRFATDRFLSV